jgi:arginine/lysine/ornithine decarboxylase
MVYLTRLHAGRCPVIAAGRNAHKTFVTAAALLDADVRWLYGDTRQDLLSCTVTPEHLEVFLRENVVDAVYITSPDYLGNVADVGALAKVCHDHECLLLVDNAHGGYLRFLEQSLHPLDLGADLCCDSAHKTLPVLTGGAYLHIGKNAPKEMLRQAKTAMALFGSTSPSYLTLLSLDRCNRYLAEEYGSKLAETLALLISVRNTLREKGWRLEESDPLRITIAAPDGRSGTDLAQSLRKQGVECEFADPDHLVLMATPENEPQDFLRVVEALGEASGYKAQKQYLSPAKGEAVCSVREAFFCARETVLAAEALGRVCAAPTVACPPAIPVAVSGERIGEEALALLRYYGVETVDVIR